MREPRISSRLFPASVLVFFANVAGRDEWMVFCRFLAQDMSSRERERRVEDRNRCV